MSKGVKQYQNKNIDNKLKKVLSLHNLNTLQIEQISYNIKINI